MDDVDVPLAEVLAGQGYSTMLVYDTPFLGLDESNYNRRIRGVQFCPWAAPGPPFDR